LKKGNIIVQLVLIITGLIIINIISHRYYSHIDLTEDQRFSLTAPTENLLADVDDPIFIRILLDGEFPAGFKRLRQSTKDMLDQYRSIAPKIIYEFQNPSPKGASNEELNNIKLELSKDGIQPTTLRYGEGDALTNRQIYPYAIFSLGQKQVVVNLLEEQVMGIPEEVILNQSVSLLEYKFSNAIQKLTLKERSNIVFTEGHGELDRQQTAVLENSLKEYYNTGRVNLDSIYQLNSDIDVLVVAKPRTNFNQRAKFLIDQYIMNGGSVLWLIDYLDVNVDSIGRNDIYVPPTMNLDLDDLWFNYGFRVQPNLVLDLQATQIPQVIGMAGGEPQFNMIKWPYHMLALPLSQHPIVKNLDRINLFFPSSIDTIQTKAAIKKEILLQSSDYTRYQLTPVRLNFQILQQDFKAELFNKSPQTVALLVEGAFESAYQNRITADMEAMLRQIEAPYKDKGIMAKQIIISDGDIINNVINVKEQKIFPLGYNKWEKRTYKGNEHFVLNAIEYLVNSENILAARSKEVRLRMIDRVKARNEKNKWRLINLALPLVLLLLFGLGYRSYRKFKYATS